MNVPNDMVEGGSNPIENRSRVQGKVAIVTGAGSGIGRAAAILLASQGATVVVADIDNRGAAACVRQIEEQGGLATAVCLDVADERAWQAAIDGVLNRFKRLDILVNNAGISAAKPIVESSIADWRKVMAINLDGVFLGTKYGIQTMRESGGSVVNVASVSGITPSPGATAYCASKAAVRMLTKTAAIESTNTGTGVRVNVVTPGGVKTPMWEREQFFQELVAKHGSADAAFAALEGDAPSQEFFTPEEVAQTILYLASDESAHLTGVEIVLNRGHAG